MRLLSPQRCHRQRLLRTNQGPSFLCSSAVLSHVHTEPAMGQALTLPGLGRWDSDLSLLGAMETLVMDGYTASKETFWMGTRMDEWMDGWMGGWMTLNDN